MLAAAGVRGGLGGGFARAEPAALHQAAPPPVPRDGRAAGPRRASGSERGAPSHGNAASHVFLAAGVATSAATLRGRRGRRGGAAPREARVRRASTSRRARGLRRQASFSTRVDAFERAAAEDFDFSESVQTCVDPDELLKLAGTVGKMDPDELDAMMGSFGGLEEALEDIDGAEASSPSADKPDVDDPGRMDVINEVLMQSGSVVFSRPSSCGQGQIVVRAIRARREHAENICADVRNLEHQWRTMQFVGDRGAFPSREGKVRDIVKGVVRVAMPPAVQGGGEGAAPTMVTEVLASGHAKSCVATALAAAQACGADLLREGGPPPRALIIGLGAGCIPAWLVDRFPRLVCDAVEVDSVVAVAAVEAMGLPVEATITPSGAAAAAEEAVRGCGGRLRVHLCAGEDFVSELAKAAPEEFRYDLVILDCACPDLPEPMAQHGGPFLQALAALLRPCAGVAVSTLVAADGQGTVSGSTPPATDVAQAFHDAAGGEAFMTRTPILETANAMHTILGFSTQPVGDRDGENLQDALKRSAAHVGWFVNSSFNLARRLDDGFKEVGGDS